MSVGLYLDVHVPYAITIGLRVREVDVITAQEGEAGELEDPALLDRATSLERILFSQDKDLLREAQSRQSSGQYFIGVVYAPQLRTSIGQFIDDLELIAKASDPDEWIGRVEYLPLK